ncbi:MFS transporter [Paragemmobacter ruber]|uniref:MFS transporter n=1 Tax=Paragemmobacter ruber TaxID=1985673 RepID=A0ABW9Y202_9RHOB|nr:MFS transporter [Rhodobacter ruber]NBE06542.1 MFS transporter [Rhodobacter ruber]
MRLPPLMLLMAAVTIVGSNSLALSPVALEIGRAFGGASAQEVLVAASLFGAGTALAAVGIAPFADRIGLSRALFLAICVLVLGMAGTALAPALWVVWLAQAVAGLGSGVALPATYGLAAEIAPKGRESTFFGRVLMGWTLSLVFGASAAALIADLAGWRAVHGVLAALGLLVLLAMALSPRMGEVRAAQGASPWAALRVPGIGAALAVAGGYMAAFYGLYAYFAPHLQVQLGWPVWMVGAVPLVYGIGFGLASLGDPWIDRFGARAVAPWVFGGLVVQYLALAAAAGWAWALVALCFSWGIINHLGLNLIVGRLAALDPARRGAVLGLNSGVTYLAMFVATAGFGWVEVALGFVACAMLSAVCVLPALGDALRRR